MVRILKSETFISLMLVGAVASAMELFLGNGHTNSAVIAVTLLASSIGLFSGMIAKAASD